MDRVLSWWSVSSPQSKNLYKRIQTDSVFIASCLGRVFRTPQFWPKMSKDSCNRALSLLETFCLSWCKLWKTHLTWSWRPESPPNFWDIWCRQTNPLGWECSGHVLRVPRCPHFTTDSTVTCPVRVLGLKLSLCVWPPPCSQKSIASSCTLRLFRCRQQNSSCWPYTANSATAPLPPYPQHPTPSMPLQKRWAQW